MRLRDITVGEFHNRGGAVEIASIYLLQAEYDGDDYKAVLKDYGGGETKDEFSCEPRMKLRTLVRNVCESRRKASSDRDPTHRPLDPCQSPYRGVGGQVFQLSGQHQSS